jgi:hypothetical protein
MFSKTPLQKLSLGAAGAIWLALGSVESANAASFKSNTFSINQPVELAGNGFGNGKARANSSDDTVEFLLTAGSFLALVLNAGDPIFQLLEELFGEDDDQTNFDDGPDANPVLRLDDFKISEGPYVKNKSRSLVSFDLDTGNPEDPTSKNPTPVPSPALLPGLLALGWKMMQKRRSEQSGVL